VNFLTSIYHPNVSMKAGGSICQDVIGTGEHWGPTLNTKFVIDKLLEMLVTPNAASPLEPEIGEMYVNSPAKFFTTAQQFTKKHAS
jgi:ubiquitin-protein ligase